MATHLDRWAERHGLIVSLECTEMTHDERQVTGMVEEWKATIKTEDGEIGMKVVTDGSYRPDALELMFGSWPTMRPDDGELAACYDVLGPAAVADLAHTLGI